MYFAGKTDKGKVRDNNEDFFFAGGKLLVIADGMGGHNAGEVASKMAVDTVVSLLENAEGDYEKLLIESIAEANKNVFEMASGEREGMGTTIDIGICDSGKLYLGHVGDSRVYVIRNNAAVKITEDHSYVEMLLKKGEITPEEAENYPMKNMITRAIGVGKEVEGDFYEFSLEAGDKILFCTDGLTNMVSDEEIADIVGKSESAEKAASALVERANAAGGKDNITVIVAEEFF